MVAEIRVTIHREMVALRINCSFNQSHLNISKTNVNFFMAITKINPYKLHGYCKTLVQGFIFKINYEYARK